MKPKFRLGQIVATPNALRWIDAEDMHVALQLHSRGCWGDVDGHEYESNRLALAGGDRLFSVYYARNGCQFWVITEADRESTTVLLPEDY